MPVLWDVVIWTEENEVSYVPSCWANPSKTLYKFPTTRNEQHVRKFLHECKDLEVDFEWHTAEVRKSGIKSLQEAKRICDKAEYTSSLDTNDEHAENETFSKFGRKKKEKKQSGSDDGFSTSTSSQEMDEANVFDALRLNRTKTNKCLLGNSTTHKNPVENVRSQSRVQTVQEERKEQTGSNFRSFRNSTLQPDSVQCRQDSSHPLLSQKYSQPVRRITNEKSDSSHSSLEPFIANRTPTNSSKFKQKLILTRTRSRSLDEADELQDDERKQNSDDFLKVYRQLSELKFELKEVSKKLVNIENLVQNFLTSSSSAHVTDESEEFLDQLPLNSVEAIDKFNIQIINDKIKFKKLVQLLYLIGGDTPKKIIYGQMSKLITNEIAKEYSAHGKQKKKCFTALKLYNAILVSTRKRLEVDEHEVKRIVGLFLTTYKSRLQNKQPTVEGNKGREAEENVAGVEYNLSE